MAPNTLPATIYHYCPLEAAISIIKTGTLRMSSICHMNDSQEYKWGASLIAEALQAVYEDTKASFFSTVSTYIRNEEFTDVYCACFSIDGDSLSQWRQYSNDGLGVALGFDPAYFNFCRIGEGWHGGISNVLELCDVCYDSTEQTARLAKSIDYLRKMVTERTTGGLKTLNDVWANTARFKSPEFKSESEWRIIYRQHWSPDGTPPPPTGFAFDVAVKGSTLVPFYVLPLRSDDSTNQFPITSIVLGPRVSKETRHSLRLFLDSQGLDKVKLNQGRSSYRTL